MTDGRAAREFTPAHIDQAKVALTRANEVRLGRAKIKRSIADGSVSIHDIISDPPPCMLGISLMELLRSQWHWQYVKSRKCLQSIALPTDKKLGTLTDRQKDLLITAIKER